MRNSTLLPLAVHFRHLLKACKSFLTLIISLLVFTDYSSAQTQTLVFDDAGTFSWVPPCGVTSATIQIWGAGGGGGGGGAASFSSTNGAGGGGGGGAYRTVTVPVTPGTNYNIVVGSGGDAGYTFWVFTNIEVDGTSGGASSFAGIYTANGGAGGESRVNGSGNGGAGGAAGTFAGGAGANGNRTSFGGGGGSGAGTAAPGTTGGLPAGGIAPAGGGNGGDGGNNSTGNDGVAPGGGGGGGRASGNASFQDGGAGGNGMVIITYNGMPTASCLPTFNAVTSITNVTFAGINNGSPTTTTIQWEQFCAQASVIVGNTYPISITGNGASGTTDYYSVFIDWNQNGDLSDDGSFNINSRVNTGTVTGNITVPAGAPTGVTRMRVIKRRTGYATGPCQNSTNGQAEDYLVLVQPLPNCATPGNPTALNLTFQSTPVYAINGSFTGSGASGYIVIQTTGATPPIAPTNGTTYPVGSNALGGTVIANGTATTFSATNIFQNTQYCYWVYAYNGNCVGAPFYSTGNATACYTTAACNTTAVMTLTNNETKDWSTAANWSPAIVPTACTHVTINFTGSNASGVRNAVASINANFNIRSLTIIGNFTNAAAFNSGVSERNMTLVNNGFTLNIQDSLNIIADNGIDQLSTGNTTNAHKIIFNSIGNSVLNVYGNTYIGGADDEKLTVFGSTGGNPLFYFWGNVTYNKYANSNPNGTYIFEKNGAASQTFTNNVSASNTSLRVLFNNLSIGQSGTSFPAVTFAGTPTVGTATTALKTGINGGTLTIKDGASLNLPNGTAIAQHTASATGSFIIGGTGQLYVGGSTSMISHSGATYNGYAGTNFPANFGNYTFSPTSTVHYNSNNTITQTIFPTATYGNLVLTNGTGSGSSIKTLNGNITGIAGNLTINPYSTFNMQSSTANRTSNGGVLTLAANGNLSVGGTSGGADATNNFPGNFASKVFATNSNTYYNFGGAQGIHGAVDYGNLYLSNTGGKTAPASLNINGNMNITGTAFLIHNSGTVAFNAASNAQTYTATTPATFYNLYNNNTHASGLTIASTANIERQISLSANSRLFLTGDIVMLSNSSTTSFVDILPASAQINYAGGGRFEIQRYIQYYQKWNLLGVPLRTTTSLHTTWQENGNLGPAVAGLGVQITGPGGGNGLDASSPGNSVKWWNAASQAFVNVSNTNTELANRAEGYYTFVRGDRNYGPGAAGNVTTLRARGEIYTGANPPATFTRTGLAANAFVSVANPYASAIDFAKVFASSTNLKSGFHVWDPTLNGTQGLGAYQYITTGGVITPGSGLYTTANVGTGYKNIQSGQVVYVEPNTAGTISINFEESHKMTGSRQLMRGEGELDDPVMMSTMLHNSNGQLIDGNRVMYHADFSNQLGAEDANKMINSGENFGLLSSSRRLIVEGRQPIVAADTIFYNMSNLRNQNYILSFAPRYLSGNGLIAELVDNYLGSRTNVSLNDSTYYNFTVNADAASKAAGRFMLVFKPVSVLPVNFVSITAQANTDRSNTVQWKVANEVNIVSYEIERSSDARNFSSILTIAATGSNVYQKTDIAPLPADNFYRIKAIGIGGEITYSPVVKISSVKMQPLITVVNPVVAKQLNLRFVQQPAGEYTIELIAANGQLIQSSRLSLNSTAVSETISLQSSLASGNYKLLIKNEKGAVAYSGSLLIQ